MNAAAQRGSEGFDDPGGEQPTKRQEKREHTRTALLDAAERLWAERGIHGASLDEIAAAAGLTKGAVYSNFTGKTDLLLALLDRYTQANLALRRCATPPCPSAEEVRPVALLLMEFWLYGMRDYAAGWRIADWYHNRRVNLARNFADAEEPPAGLTTQDRATIAMALELGLTLQHLLDPDRVSAELYASGMRSILGTAPTEGTDCVITAG
jgi:AcrR family transcriptional regulator